MRTSLGDALAMRMRRQVSGCSSVQCAPDREVLSRMVPNNTVERLESGRFRTGTCHWERRRSTANRDGSSGVSNPSKTFYLEHVAQLSQAARRRRSWAPRLRVGGRLWTVERAIYTVNDLLQVLQSTRRELLVREKQSASGVSSTHFSALYRKLESHPQVSYNKATKRYRCKARFGNIHDKDQLLKYMRQCGQGLAQKSRPTYTYLPRSRK